MQRIKKDRSLKHEEIEFVVGLVMGWIEGQKEIINRVLCEKNVRKSAKIE